MRFPKLTLLVNLVYPADKVYLIFNIARPKAKVYPLFVMSSYASSIQLQCYPHFPPLFSHKAGILPVIRQTFSSPNKTVLHIAFVQI
uniref:Uncharacterized protein n=1 Tax=Anguilla anguilla TaxID=7936 RepID=A0A0E9Y2E6_ANGAN